MRLDVKDLRFRYESMDMRFDLTVGDGDFAAVIGPSGAGKSTLLSLIGGFDRPTSGRILADGVDIAKLEPSQRPVTTLFQEHNLFAHLNVFKNIAIGIQPSLQVTTAQKQLVDDALNSVGLVGFERRLPGELSGGERQRVALARCLVRQRPLLLLDEPFAALGPGMRQEMLGLVVNLQRRTNLTVMMVTHDPRDAIIAARNAIFVAGGEVIMADTTPEVLGSDHPTIRAYLGDFIQ